MEQRHELRIEFGKSVAVTHLHRDDGRWSGRFVDLSSDGMSIKLDSGLIAGSLLMQETRGGLLVAEVCQSESDGAEYCASLSLLKWMEKSELERLIREAFDGPVHRPVLQAVAA